MYFNYFIADVMLAKPDPYRIPNPSWPCIHSDQGRKYYATPIRFKLPYTLLLGLRSKHNRVNALHTHANRKTPLTSNDSNTRAPISTAKTDIKLVLNKYFLVRKDDFYCLQLYTRTIFHNLLTLHAAPTVTSLGRLFDPLGHHFATLAIKIHQPTVKQPLIHEFFPTEATCSVQSPLRF